MSHLADIVSIMTSIALQYWRNHRLHYLDDLLVREPGGSKRRVRLARQWQGPRPGQCESWLAGP